MRTLKFAVLGLLNRRPMTGYEIGKEFDYELGQFWNAKHSQIYPELKKLLDEGLVVFDVEISGDILEKKRYTITEKGQLELLKWLHKDEPVEKTPKDIFRLRMYFSNNLDLESRIHLLESQLIQHKKRLSILNKTMEQYQGGVPPHYTDRFGDFIVLESAILREEYVIKWIDKCMSYCKDALEKEQGKAK